VLIDLKEPAAFHDAEEAEFEAPLFDSQGRPQCVSGKRSIRARRQPYAQDLIAFNNAHPTRDLQIF
jgi:hypothetical protein